MDQHTMRAVTRTLILAVVTMLALPGTSLAGDVGIRHLTAHSEPRAQNLDVLVWYPAAAGNETVPIGNTVFFKGTPAAPDAPIADGHFPLIVLSHGAGLGGRADAASWIATALAERGFIVAAPTHPGNTGPNRSAAKTIKLWQRPADISATLDAIAASAVFAPHLAPQKVGLLGLSMGGNTALLLSGARIDPARFARTCDGALVNTSLCEWLALSGVDLHAIDLSTAADDTTDPRIKIAMAVDPGLIDVLAPASASAIDIPFTLVNLGPAGALHPTVDGSDIAARIPNGTYVLIEDANHFSMFGECTPSAAAIAKEDGIDEPICTDGGTRSRRTIHADLATLAAKTFAPLHESRFNQSGIASDG